MCRILYVFRALRLTQHLNSTTTRQVQDLWTQLYLSQHVSTETVHSVASQILQNVRRGDITCQTMRLCNAVYYPVRLSLVPPTIQVEHECLDVCGLRHCLVHNSKQAEVVLTETNPVLNLDCTLGPEKVAKLVEDLQWTGDVVAFILDGNKPPSQTLISAFADPPGNLPVGVNRLLHLKPVYWNLGFDAS